MITNYAIKSNDIIFCEKLKNSESDYCIFGIDFDKVNCYKVVKSVWKDGTPAILVSIIMETGKKYVLLKKTSDSEEILSEITNFNSSKEVDLKYIFDLLIYG